jgi:hypothetical protein
MGRSQVMTVIPQKMRQQFLITIYRPGQQFDLEPR